MRLWVALVVVACGGPPSSQPTLANRPSAPQQTSCNDVGVILRGPLVNDDPKAGPAKERAIATACRDDRWSPELLHCIASSREPAKCVDQLSKPQQAAYQAKLEAWTAQYGGDMYGGDMYGGMVGGRYVDCADLVDDPDKYPPPVQAERDWQNSQRRPVIERICNNEGWAEATKECVLDAADMTAVDTCLQNEPSKAVLAKAMTDIDAVAQRLAMAKSKPAQVSCAKAVEAHYGDPQWKDKLVGVKAADRKKQITASRDAMKKACTDEAWSDTLRACIVIGDDTCLDASFSTTWGYPAIAAVPLPANVPGECAHYRADVLRFAQCQNVPQATRDAVKQALDTMQATWVVPMPKEALAALASGCKQTDEALHQLASGQCGF